MRNKFKMLLSVLLVCVMLTGLLPATAASANTGLDFDDLGTYTTADTEMLLPATYEATVFFPADYSGRGGVIVGDYAGDKVPLFNFEIHNSGRPRLYINDKDLVNYNVIFTDVNVYNGKPTHIAITVDHASGVWRCYVDGVLKQTIETAAPEPFVVASKFMMGGDFREGNTQYFKGSLLGLSLYKDVRSPEEIAADASGNALDINDLICGYDLSDVSAGSRPDSVRSQPTRWYDFTYYSDWVKTVPAPEEYAYSFAVIGDIQSLTYYYPDQLNTLYDWIRDNAESKKIKYAIGLGDVTDKNKEVEYERVVEAYEKIDGVVPFSIIRGNHDRSGTSSANFDSYITQARYGDEITGAYDGSMLNTYRILQVGNVKYLFMNLDFLLKDEVLDWANDVISQNSDCRVIVSTHIYMTYKGAYYSLEGTSGIGTKYSCENNGEDLWNKVLSKHENVVMLLCGHNPTDNIYQRTKTGDHGNKVTEILIDPQTTDKNYGGTGLVAMFYFSEDGKQLEVQYYSTAKDAYFKSNNQFKLTLDVPETEPSNPNQPDGDSNQMGDNNNPNNNTQGGDSNQSEADRSDKAPPLPSRTELIIMIAAGAAVLLVGVVLVIVIIKRKR